MTTLIEPRLTTNPYKVAIVGDSGVGKSSIASRLSHNYFREAYSPTIGIDYKQLSVRLPTSKRHVQLELFDVGGLKKFAPIASAFYNSCFAVVIVFDVAKRSSFESVPRWLESLRFYVPPDAEVVLVGSKADVEEREVSAVEAETFASAQGLSFFETSAKTGLNVSELFVEICSRINEKVEIGNGAPETTSLSPFVVETGLERRPNWCLFCFCV